MWDKSYWGIGAGVRLACQYETLILTATAFYIPVLWIAQRVMEHRQPFRLKYVCFLWNLGLSISSGIGVVVILLCDPWCLTKMMLPEYRYHPWVRACISTFCITKAVEFGDTLLLVLKKKQLRFLHVYHHLTVTLYCWHALKIGVSFGHFFAFINLLIHCFMYLYYAAAVLQPRHPFLLATRSYITMSQTAQMFVGMWLSWTALFHKAGGGNGPSALERENAVFALLMYTSYAYLFILFYFETYIKDVRPSMVVAIVTLHFGGVVGAAFAWSHPHRKRILLELAIGYAFTALSVHCCCLSPSRVVHSQNLLGALLVSKRSSPNHGGLADSSKARPSTGTTHTGVSAILCEHFTKRFFKTSTSFSSLFPARSDTTPLSSDSPAGDKCFATLPRDAPWTTQKRERHLRLDYSSKGNEPDPLAQLPHASRSAAALPTTTIPWRTASGPVRQALVLFNAWVLTALEEQYKLQQPLAPSVTSAQAGPISTRQPPLGRSDAVQGVSSEPPNQASPSLCSNESSRPSPVTLSQQHGPSLDVHSIRQEKQQQWLFFTVSLLVPAAYGFLAHGNLLLGVLVHGCLRWVIELYTTGALVSK